MATAQLLFLYSGHPVDGLLVDVEMIHYLVVEDAHTAGGNGAHGQFLALGDAQLAHQEEIQRRVQRRGHLVGHGHTASGQAQD